MCIVFFGSERGYYSGIRMGIEFFIYIGSRDFSVESMNFFMFISIGNSMSFYVIIKRLYFIISKFIIFVGIIL